MEIEPLPVISRSLVYYNPDESKYYVVVPPHAVDSLNDVDDGGGSLVYMLFLMKKKGWKVVPCSVNEKLLTLASIVVKDGAICFEKQEQ